MALIRGVQAGHLVKDAVVLDLGDLQRQGAEMVARARREGEQIVNEARQERERILAGAAEAGRVEGHARGMQEGRKEGAEQARGEALVSCKQELGKLIEAWTGALRAFGGQRDGFIQAAERDVIRLASVIAEKVVKRSVELDVEIVVEQVRATLATVVRPSEAVIVIHPADRATVESALGGLLAEMPSVRHVDVVDDSTGRLARGSCVARMRDPERAGIGGEVDASIETQIDRIVSALLPGDEEQQGESNGSYSR